MAGISSSGKTHCPVCGAAVSAGREGGSPRWLDSRPIPLSNDPVIVFKRARANRIKQQNIRGSKK